MPTFNIFNLFNHKQPNRHRYAPDPSQRLTALIYDTKDDIRSAQANKPPINITEVALIIPDQQGKPFTYNQPKHHPRVSDPTKRLTSSINETKDDIRSAQANKRNHPIELTDVALTLHDQQPADSLL